MNEETWTQEELDNRFQFQPWYIKAWRYRYYITIPYYAIPLYFYNLISYLDKELSFLFCDGPAHDERFIPFKTCWSIAKGCAQHCMGWYYTSAEVGYPDGFAQFAEDDLEDTENYPAGYLNLLLTPGVTVGSKVEPGVVSLEFRQKLNILQGK